MTSAPQSARIRPHIGAAKFVPISKTLIPSSGFMATISISKFKSSCFLTLPSL